MRQHIDAGAAFSERVRVLFNSRAEAWSRKYGPEGKLVWRLAEFAEPLGQLVRPPASVLDFGCGTGDLAMHLWIHGYRVTGCDIAELMLTAARRNFGDAMVDWVTLNAGCKHLPFPDERFDAVVASSVLEYVADVEQVLAELSRVLREGGVLLFNIPDPANRRRRREQWLEQATRPAWVRGTVGIIPRVRRLRRYLELSKNRFLLSEWQWRAALAGLHSVDVRGKTESRPLALLAFRKVAPWTRPPRQQRLALREAADAD